MYKNRHLPLGYEEQVKRAQLAMEYEAYVVDTLYPLTVRLEEWLVGPLMDVEGTFRLSMIITTPDRILQMGCIPETSPLIGVQAVASTRALAGKIFGVLSDYLAVCGIDDSLGTSEPASPWIWALVPVDVIGGLENPPKRFVFRVAISDMYEWV